MGFPMSKHVVASGVDVLGCDLADAARQGLIEAGGAAVAPSDLDLSLPIIPSGTENLPARKARG